MSFWAATYNVLANAYLNPAWYRNVPAELLRPTWRMPALLEHIESLAADLFCLQEVEAGVFTALQERLEGLGYLGHHELKGGGRPDGCATFFRADLFTLRQVQRLDYHDGAGPQPDSGHIALLLALDYQGQLLGVANTHLRWDKPGTPVSEQLGYRQITQLLEACHQFIPACRGWLVCGDFNCTPRSEVLAALHEASFDYAHASCPGAHSCVANGKARLIDYLCYSPELWARPADLPTIWDDTPLPSKQQPSDHLALLAELDWA
jgi:mRNA deadenylase 3'-5' endonuclease subunit Ccr4